MRAPLKIAITLTALFVVLGMAVLVLFIFPATYLGVARLLIQSSTGYAVQVNSIQVDSFPLEMKLHNLRVYNPEWESGDPVLEAQQFTGKVNLYGYFAGASNWWEASVSEVTARYIVLPDGLNNWVTGLKRSSGSKERSQNHTEFRNTESEDSDNNGNKSADFLFAFDSIRVKDFLLIHGIEGAAGEAERLQITSLSLDKNQDESVNVSMQGTYMNQPLNLSGLFPLPSSDMARDVDLKGLLFGSEWNISGRVGHDGITPGKVDIAIEADDLSSLTNLTGMDFSRYTPLDLQGTIEAPDLSKWITSLSGEFGRHRLSLDNTVVIDERRYIVENFSFNSGFAVINGIGQADADTHSLVTRLHAEQLNIDQLVSFLNLHSEFLSPQEVLSPQTVQASSPEPAQAEERERAEMIDDFRQQLARAGEYLNSWSVNIQSEFESLVFSGYALSDLSVDVVTQGAELQIDAQLPESSDQSRQNGFENILPVRLSAGIFLEPERVSVNDLELAIRGEGMQGNLVADLSRSVLELDGELTIERLNVQEILSAMKHGQGSATQDNDDTQTNLVDSETDEINTVNALKSRLADTVEVMQSLSLDLQIQAASLQIPGYQLSGLDASVVSDATSVSTSIMLESLDQVLSAGLPMANDSVTRDYLQTIFPLSATADISIEPERIDFTNLEITLDGDTVEGQLLADLTNEIPSFEGRLAATLIDVDKFSIYSSKSTGDRSAEIDADTTGGVEPDNDDLIGDQPLDWSWLSAIQLNLGVKSDLIRINSTDFRNLAIELSMRNSVLLINPLTADLAKGGVSGDFRIEQLESGASITGNLIATDLTPADLGQPDTGLIDGGETDLAIDLATRGRSLQELASSLNGEITLEIQQATLRNNFFEIIGSDVLTQFVDLINPFAKDDGQTELECAAIYFQAEDGILTSSNKLAIETSKMKIRGGGEINLNNETLQIDFVPSARSGLGISLGSLASVIRLGGTLANPRPEADPGGILRSGANIGAAVATGGLSLIAKGLFDRARNTVTSCGQIFEENTDVPSALGTVDGDAQAREATAAQ